MKLTVPSCSCCRAGSLARPCMMPGKLAPCEPGSARLCNRFRLPSAAATSSFCFAQQPLKWPMWRASSEVQAERLLMLSSHRPSGEDWPSRRSFLRRVQADRPDTSMRQASGPVIARWS
jgi:hypothetical protein